MISISMRGNRLIYNFNTRTVTIATLCQIVESSSEGHICDYDNSQDGDFRDNLHRHGILQGRFTPSRSNGGGYRIIIRNRCLFRTRQLLGGPENEAYGPQQSG